MMKKVILCTMVSLFVFSAFVAGPWWADLAGAGEAVAAKCSDLPGVEACILIMPGGHVEPAPGKDNKGKVIEFKKPKKKGGGNPDQAKPGTVKDRNELPPELEDDIPTAQFIENKVNIYGDKTCMNINGNWYCW